MVSSGRTRNHMLRDVAFAFGVVLGNAGPRRVLTMARHETEDLGTGEMNGRVAGIISRYWKRQGYKVEVGADNGPVRSNLRCGLPPGYDGEDAIPITTR